MANMSLKKVPMPEQDPNVRNKNFLEVSTGYTEEMAKEEATRCLNCKNSPCVNGCPVNVHIHHWPQWPLQWQYSPHSQYRSYLPHHRKAYS